MKKAICAVTALLLVFFSFPNAYANEGAVGSLTGDIVTRGEFVTAINETFNFYTVLGTEDKFTDVALGDSDYYEIMAARRSGYLNGYPDGSVCPENYITRAEAAAVLKQVLDLPQPTILYSFADQAEIPQWAIESVQAVTDAGIMTPTENNAFKASEALKKNELENIISAAKALRVTGQREDKITEITSFDGFKITGRLSMPAGNDDIDKIVIFIHGTGPNTYEMRRKNDSYGIRFKYLDTYADSFVKDGTAFFAYNTRGITLGEGSGFAPDAVIDTESYRGYTPQNVARDISYMIGAVKSEPRLKNAKVYLLGVSEGTIIAPLAVNKYGAEADALLLAGYCNDNMIDVLKYQLGGGMSYFNYTVLFDAVGHDSISKEQFEADPNGVLATIFAGVAFEDIDATADGVLKVDDLAILMKPIMDGLFEAVEKGDDKWIEDNMSNIMPTLLTDWFSAHFKLSKTEDIMTEVDIPIYIFQGTYDANCPVQGTYDVEAKFKALGKDNLTVNIYEGYSHDLNYEQWLYGMGSDAFDDIFRTVEAFK